MFCYCTFKSQIHLGYEPKMNWWCLLHLAHWGEPMFSIGPINSRECLKQNACSHHCQTTIIIICTTKI